MTNSQINIDEIKKERVLIAGFDTGRRDQIKIESSMAELKELVKAAGGEVVGEVVQKRPSIDKAFYLGKGKIEEMEEYCENLEVDTVVFNNELSGSQIRNIEAVLKKKVLDRTGLILDIFATRATTKEGKLQVELAQLKYKLPRLMGLGASMSRTGAGIGTRGPGEQKHEIDRRHILSRVTEIKKQLKEIVSVRETKRQKRIESELPIISLVGYTNAGKSTLLNTLIKDDENYTEDKKVFEKDMLFATLDTSLRRGTLPNGHGVLITDTVGFVSQLPHNLVEAFKSTLEEVKYSDLILHVIDMTNEDLEIQMKTTMKILKELNALEKPMITVINKCDKGNQEDFVHEIEGEVIYVSAKENINIEKLKLLIQENLPKNYYDVKMVIPYSESKIASYIHENTKIQSCDYSEEGTVFKTILDEVDYNKYKRYIVEE